MAYVGYLGTPVNFGIQPDEGLMNLQRRRSIPAIRQSFDPGMSNTVCVKNQHDATVVENLRSGQAGELALATTSANGKTEVRRVLSQAYLYWDISPAQPKNNSILTGLLNFPGYVTKLYVIRWRLSVGD